MDCLHTVQLKGKSPFFFSSVCLSVHLLAGGGTAYRENYQGFLLGGGQGDHRLPPFQNGCERSDLKKKM